MADDPTDSGDRAATLKREAGAFAKLPDHPGPTLATDGTEGGRQAAPADGSETPSHIQEGVTVSGDLAESSENRDPYDRPETTEERTVKAAGAQLMPR